MLGLAVLVCVSVVMTTGTVEVGSRHYNSYRDPAYSSYGSYGYYNQYNQPYTMYKFCAANMYTCLPTAYTDFCLTYETTCGYTSRLATIPRTYHYYLYTQYCQTWCSRCSTNYVNSCSLTTTAATTTTTAATTTTTAATTTTTAATTTTTAATTTTTAATTTTTAATTTTTAATTTTTAATTTTVATTTTTVITKKCEYSNFEDTVISRIGDGSIDYQCHDPWLVAIKPSVTGVSLPPMCTGMLVDETHVVTTSECKEMLAPFGTNYQVTVGEYMWQADEPGDQDIDVSSVTEDTASGLMTLTLSNPVTYDRCVAPACLESKDSTIQVDPSTCEIVGWGEQNAGSGPSSLLNLGNVALSPDCTDVLSLVSVLDPNLVSFNDPTSVGCTSPSGSSAAACTGDAGGPVTCTESTTGERIVVGLMKNGTCSGSSHLTFFVDLSSDVSEAVLNAI